MNAIPDEYVTQYSGDLTRLCMSLCGNRVDAEDLFQDTWLKAARHFKCYQPDKPFLNWLFTICVNTFKNSVNAAYRQRRYTFASDAEREMFFAAIPDTTAENTDEYAALHEAIGKLTKKQRAVVALFYFRDFSISDIAEMLKIPEGTVKSRLSAARAEIKRRLENEA